MSSSPLTSPPIDDLDDYLSSQISPLSDTQEQWLSSLTLVSALLSIFGSSTIIFKTCQTLRTSKPYDRLLLGLSITDIIASTSYALSPFLVPSATSQRVWAIGNDATCTLLGWWTQLGFSAVWYNTLLSCYYLLTVRFKVSRQHFAKKWEPYFHSFTALYFLTTATVGASLDWYQEFNISQGCWVGEIPQGCEAAGTCTGKGQIVGWLFGGICMILTYLILVINNSVIYWHVRSTFIKTTQPSQLLLLSTQQQDEQQHTSILQTSSLLEEGGGGTSSFRFQNDMDEDDEDDVIDEDRLTSDSPTAVRPPSRSGSWVRPPSRSGSLVRSSSMVVPPSPKTPISVHSLDPQIQERISRQQAHIREVASQGFLYVACFFVSFTPAFIIRVLDSIGFSSSDEDALFPLLVASAILLPLQGFFNMLVHTRPAYHRFRAAYPELSKVWALRRACLDADVPRLSDAQWSTSFKAPQSNPRTPSSPRRKPSKSIKGQAPGRSFASDLDVLKEGNEEDEASSTALNISQRNRQAYQQDEIQPLPLDSWRASNSPQPQQQLLSSRSPQSTPLDAGHLEGKDRDVLLYEPSVEVVMRQPPQHQQEPVSPVKERVAALEAAVMAYESQDLGGENEEDLSGYDTTSSRRLRTVPEHSRSIGISGDEADGVDDSTKPPTRKLSQRKKSKTPQDLEALPTLKRKESKTKPKRKSSKVILKEGESDGVESSSLVKSPSRKSSKVKRKSSKLLPLPPDLFPGTDEDEDSMERPVLTRKVSKSRPKRKSSKVVAKSSGQESQQSDATPEALPLLTRKESKSSKPGRKSSKMVLVEGDQRNEPLTPRRKSSKHVLGPDGVSSPRRKSSKHQMMNEVGEEEPLSLKRKSSKRRSSKVLISSDANEVEDKDPTRALTRKESKSKHKSRSGVVNGEEEDIFNPLSRREGKQKSSQVVTSPLGDGVEDILVRTPTRRKSSKPKRQGSKLKKSASYRRPDTDLVNINDEDEE